MTLLGLHSKNLSVSRKKKIYLNANVLKVRTSYIFKYFLIAIMI